MARVERDQLVRVVVGVDPATTSHEKSDETGIIVAGVDRKRQGYVREDATCRLSPNQWARRVASVYHRWKADRIIAEVTGGHDLVESVLRTVDPALPITKVNARVGKSAWAEPIAALYEQGRVHHVGMLAELEDQLCTWVPGQTGSPDRLEALVWALTHLTPGAVSVGAPELVGAGESRWGFAHERAGW
jgi:phage terminase large subunit-like protein